MKAQQDDDIFCDALWASASVALARKRILADYDTAFDVSFDPDAEVA
ncbi:MULTISPECIES: hypothetical protein [unclassified Cryobacterium]|nr:MULTISPECIES: hypothetical protein [unclassified Cryobacterium]